ncbi:MAG: hypothetical protein WB660_18050 [Candidatus Sulfotelmatobacter sp.]
MKQFLEETKTKTEFAAPKRVVLQGKTTEVIDHISDGELDLAYIEADHTLKGIAIDLIRVYPKLRVGVFSVEMTSRARFGSTKLLSSRGWSFPLLSTSPKR